MIDGNARACDRSVLQARAIAPPLGCSLVMVRIFRQNVHSDRITAKPRSLMKAAKVAHEALPCPRGQRAAPRRGNSTKQIGRHEKYSGVLIGMPPMVGSLCLLGRQGRPRARVDRRKLQRWDGGSDNSRPLMRPYTPSICPLWPGC
jgi:hypothetical protein